MARRVKSRKRPRVQNRNNSYMSNRSHKSNSYRSSNYPQSQTVMPPIDVKSPKDIGNMMKRIMKGPVTVVLVYADWCGHCHTFMPVFDDCAKSNQRTSQVVKVNEKVLPMVEESLNKMNQKVKSLNANAYPTVLTLNKNGENLANVDTNKEMVSAVMNRSAKIMQSPTPIPTSIHTSQSNSGSISNTESLELFEPLKPLEPLESLKPYSKSEKDYSLPSAVSMNSLKPTQKSLDSLHTIHNSIKPNKTSIEYTNEPINNSTKRVRRGGYRSNRYRSNKYRSSLYQRLKAQEGGNNSDSDSDSDNDSDNGNDSDKDKDIEQLKGGEARKFCDGFFSALANNKKVKIKFKRK